jgi:hypothetical protein
MSVLLMTLSVMPQVPAYVDGPPSALVAVGDAATALVDAARRSNWTDAAAAVQAMKTAAPDLELGIAAGDRRLLPPPIRKSYRPYVRLRVSAPRRGA